MTTEQLKERIAELEAKQVVSDNRLKELAQKAANNGAGEIRFELVATSKNEGGNGKKGNPPPNWVPDESKECKVEIKIDGDYKRGKEYVKKYDQLFGNQAVIKKGLDVLREGGLGYERAGTKHVEKIGQ